MARVLVTLLVLLFTCCSADTNHKVHDHIITQDLRNKQPELDILRELKIAQHNNDEEAFKFYVSEYVRVPRLYLTDEHKQHPKYKQWISDDVIKSGDFVKPEYDYIVK